MRGHREVFLIIIERNRRFKIVVKILEMVLKMFGGGLEDGHEMVMIESIGWTGQQRDIFWLSVLRC